MSHETYPHNFYPYVDSAMTEVLTQSSLQLEAKRGRQIAAPFKGKPEVMLLLRLAREFDRLSLLSPETRRRQAAFGAVKRIALAFGIGKIALQAAANRYEHCERLTHAGRRRVMFFGKLLADFNCGIDDIDRLLGRQQGICDQAMKQTFAQQQGGFTMRIDCLWALSAVRRSFIVINRLVHRILRLGERKYVPHSRQPHTLPTITVL